MIAAMAVNSVDRKFSRAMMFLSERQYTFLKVASVVSLALVGATAAHLAFDQVLGLFDPTFLHQLGAEAGKVLTSQPAADQSCDFRVTVSGNSVHAVGTVPVADALARNDPKFSAYTGSGYDVTPTRIWNVCGDFSGRASLGHVQGEGPITIVQNGPVLHTERFVVSEILPPYKTTPPHPAVSAIGPCDAAIVGTNATFDCTLSK